jgi:hypothetical protein
MSGLTPVSDILAEMSVSKLAFDRMEVGSRFELADHVLRRGDVVQWRDEFEHRTITEFRSYLYARTVDKWPATWWDAFKDRWFPAWAKRRWPVEWRRLKQVVPELDAPGTLHPMYLPFDMGNQRLFPHGRTPVAIQPYNLQVPLEQIEDLAMQAYHGGAVPYLDTGHLEQVLQWVHEYKRLTEE